MKDLDKFQLKSIKKNFDKFGYVKVTNVINKRIIIDLQKTIYLRFLNYLTKTKHKNVKSFSSINFHKELLILKKNNPQKFGSFFDSVQYSLNIYKIFGSKKFLGLVSNIMNVDQKKISFNGVSIRIDAPRDRKKVVSWHQERGYYHQNRSGNKGMFCWIPLMNITKNSGALNVCRKSSLEGFVKTKRKLYEKYSSKYAIKSNIIKKYTIDIPTPKISDVLFLNNNTIHRSGKNISKYFRFTILIRFHDLSDKYYLPFSSKYIYNKYEINRMIKLGLDLSDLQ